MTIRQELALALLRAKECVGVIEKLHDDYVAAEIRDAAIELANQATCDAAGRIGVPHDEFRQMAEGTLEPRTGPPYNEHPPGGPHLPGEPPPTSNG